MTGIKEILEGVFPTIYDKCRGPFILIINPGDDPHLGKYPEEIRYVFTCDTVEAGKAYITTLDARWIWLKSPDSKLIYDGGTHK